MAASGPGSPPSRVCTCPLASTMCKVPTVIKGRNSRANNIWICLSAQEFRIATRTPSDGPPFSQLCPGNSGKLKNRIATNPRLPLSGLKVVVLEGHRYHRGPIQQGGVSMFELVRLPRFATLAVLAAFLG